jgi:hypothetical protein
MAHAGSFSASRFWLGLLVIVLVCDAWVVLSEPRLPPTVMTKWTASRATSFMTRHQWILSALFYVTVPSLVVGGGVRALTRRWPRLAHPRLATISPTERARVMPVVDAGTFGLAGVIALWFTGFHFIIVRANETSPPTREVWPLLVWVLALLVAVGAGALVLHRRLRQALARDGR